MKRGALLLAVMLGVSARCLRRCRVRRARRSSRPERCRAAAPTFCAPTRRSAAAAVSLWFRAPGAGYDNASPGISRLAATAAAAAPLASRQIALRIGAQRRRRLEHQRLSGHRQRGRGRTRSAGAAHRRRDDRRILCAVHRRRSREGRHSATRRSWRCKQYVRGREDLLHDPLFAQLFASGPAHYSPIPTTSDADRTALRRPTSTPLRSARSARATRCSRSPATSMRRASTR